MRITLRDDATSALVSIPKGDYWVSLQSEAGEIVLSGGGKDYRIKAIRRRAQARSKSTTVQFQSGGAKTWSIIVSTPKHGEWIAFIDYLPAKKQ